MKLGAWILATAIVMTLMLNDAKALQMSGGLDSRFRVVDGASMFAIDGAFVNLRHLIADSTGDRVILIMQLDFEDNFNSSHFYNTYAQLKGGLGRRNVRLGRYILPFGILNYYDTERLPLHTLDPVSLGIKTDLGASVFGFVGPLDYILSVSNGAGRLWEDPDDNKAITGRLGLNWSGTKFGLSYLNGLIVSHAENEDVGIPVYMERAALDIEQLAGVALLRGELVLGRDGSQTVAGGYFGLDYALSPQFEVNAKYALWNSSRAVHFPGIGLSYAIVPGAFLRLADTIEIRNGDITNHEFRLQFYAEFLQHL